jgi:hypothetical protein
MSESETAMAVHAASVTFRHPASARAGTGWPTPEEVSQAARQAVTAWVMAVNGDDTLLAAMAEPQAARFLLHPPQEAWQVAPDPRVSSIEIWADELDALPPRLRLNYRFTGLQVFDDPGRAAKQPAATEFAGMLDLTPAPGSTPPWRLTSGHVRTLDQYYGYVFTSRPETPDEFARRASAAAGPAPAAPLRAFQVRARFADHDERFAATVSVGVLRETAPDRAEAEALVWPEIESETARALGDGDWRPSLLWIDVIELADGQPPA